MIAQINLPEGLRQSAGERERGGSNPKWLGGGGEGVVGRRGGWGGGEGRGGEDIWRRSNQESYVRRR